MKSEPETAHAHQRTDADQADGADARDPGSGQQDGPGQRQFDPPAAAGRRISGRRRGVEHRPSTRKPKASTAVRTSSATAYSDSATTTFTGLRKPVPRMPGRITKRASDGIVYRTLPTPRIRRCRCRRCAGSTHQPTGRRRPVPTTTGTALSHACVSVSDASSARLAQIQSISSGRPRLVPVASVTTERPSSSATCKVRWPRSRPTKLRTNSSAGLARISAGVPTCATSPPRLRMTT